MDTNNDTRETLDALRAELGGDLPAGLDALTDDALRHLLASIRAQKTHQRGALEEAIAQGLTVVPAMLRGAVRKILFKG